MDWRHYLFVCSILCIRLLILSKQNRFGIFSWFGQYGVQLFFVISGFVIPWSMQKAGYQFKNFFHFFLKRISRLEPPYLFSVLLALLLYYLRESYYGKPNEHLQISTPQIALHLGYLIPFFKQYQWLNLVYWMAIEFQYYLLIAIIFVPMIGSTFYVRLMMYGVLMLLSIFGNYKFSHIGCRYFFWV